MTPLDAMKNVLGFLEDEYPNAPMTVKFRDAIAELNNAIAEELEQMAKVFEKQGWPFGADDLTHRAKELREMK